MVTQLVPGDVQDAVDAAFWPAVRAAAYVRISSDDDSKIKGLGVGRQEKGCRALIDASGWQMAATPRLDLSRTSWVRDGVYCDNNISASRDDVVRPAFLRLMADVEAGLIDRIVILSQDRLVRKPEELEVIIRAMRKHKIAELDTVTDGKVNLEALTGRLMARVKNAFDKHYAEYIQQKVLEKKDELAERGLPSGGGRRPFGYERDGMTICKPEAALIREATARIIGGEALISVCRDWEARSIRTVTGAGWTANVLRGLLKAPRIAGLRQHRKVIIGDAQWPGIITVDDWRLLAELFARRKGTRSSNERHLLTGILICGSCGVPLWSGGSGGKRQYRCRQGPGFKGCGKLSIMASAVEDHLVEKLFSAVESPNLVAATANRPLPTTGQDIAQLEDRLRDLAEMWAGGEITRQEWSRARELISTRLRAAQEQVRKLSADDVLAPYLTNPSLLRDSWDGDTIPTETKRRLLAAVIESVTISPVALRGSHNFDEGRVGTPAYRV